MYESGRSTGKEEGKQEGIAIGENNVINNAIGGIAADGDYVWAWAEYNGTVFATSSMTVSGGGSDVTVSEMWIDSSDYQTYVIIGWTLTNGASGTTTINL